MQGSHAFPKDSRTTPGQTADSAIRLTRHCRRQLHLLSALVSSPALQPGQIRRIAARLNRHLRHLEETVAELHATAQEQPRALPESAPSALAAYPLRFEPQADTGISALEFEELAHSRRIWLTVSAVSAALALICCFWVVIIYRQMAVVPDAARVAPPAEIHSSLVAQAPAAPSPAPDFSESVEQLNNALDRFPNKTPREVLTSVRDENAARGVSVCNFEWNGGEARLLYGSGRGHVALDAVMGNCADAVDKAADGEGHTKPPLLP